MDQHIMNMTLLQSLRSGNIIIDLMIAAMVPMMFCRVWPHIYTVWDYFRSFVKGNIKAGTYRREITYVKSSPFHDYEEKVTSNGLLQHAIRAYIGSQISNDFNSGKIRLTHIERDTTYDCQRFDFHSEYDEDEEEEKDTKPKPTQYEQLDLPNSESNPVEILPGLFFSETIESYTLGDNTGDKSGKDKNIEVKYIFISSGINGKNGNEVIDDFIELVYAWYVKEVEKKEDHSRWMYQPLVKEAKEGTKERIYKRYKLSDEKTFKSLFFSEKDRVLKLLETFEKKQGKYSIKGFPHKLGLLLHGPPGTGKTSLVKAIASKTGRHIVSIPLSRIRTNQELLDIMLDGSFKYVISDKENGDDGEGKTKRVTLAFDKVVFLLEDVDAASVIVRKGDDEEDSKCGLNIDSGLAMDSEQCPNTTHIPESSFDEDDTSKVEKDNENANAELSDNIDRGKTEALIEKQTQHMSEMMDMMRLTHKTQQQQFHLQNKLIAEGGDGKKGLDLSDIMSDIMTNNTQDKLSLAGLLAVLDGVVDTPGRILVMTTNYPDKLDPSILRPGRINMQLYMGPLKEPEMIEMLKHYYSDVGEDDVSVVVGAFRKLCSGGGRSGLSPADFEQMCAEEYSVGDLVQRMERAN